MPCAPVPCPQILISVSSIYDLHQTGRFPDPNRCFPCVPAIQADVAEHGTRGGYCELQADSQPGNLVPTVGRSVPTIGECSETGSAEEMRYPLIFQGLAPVLNDGMSDARGD